LLSLQNIINIVALSFFVSKKATPGATDNLTGVASIMGVAKILNDWKKQFPELLPKNTEVIVTIMGSEEIGLRGALAFARAHAEEFNEIDTTVVNCDSLTESKSQTIFTRENTTRTDLSPEVYNLLAKSCEVLGIGYNPKKIVRKHADAIVNMKDLRTLLAVMGMGQVGRDVAKRISRVS